LELGSERFEPGRVEIVAQVVDWRLLPDRLPDSVQRRIDLSVRVDLEQALAADDLEALHGVAKAGRRQLGAKPEHGQHTVPEFHLHEGGWLDGVGLAEAPHASEHADCLCPCIPAHQVEHMNASIENVATVNRIE